MSDSEEFYPAQYVVRCDFCDTDFDVTWVCHTCDVSICQRCKKVHLEKEKFRDHKVLTRGAVQPKRPMEGDKCQKHSPNKHSACCVECQVPVCLQCITDNHKGHTFIDIQKAIDQCKGKLSNYRDSLERNCYADITKKIQMFELDEESAQKQADGIIDSIQKERKMVVSLVNDLYDALIRDVRKEREKERSESKQMVTNLESKRKTVAKILRKCDDKLKSRDVKIIGFENQCPSLSELSPGDLPPRKSLRFVAGSIDKSYLGKRIGRIVFDLGYADVSQMAVSVDDTILSTFQTSLIGYNFFGGEDISVCSVANASPSDAWVSNVNCKELHRYNNKGVKMSTIKAGFDIKSFVIDSTGNFIACDCDNCCIKKITKQGKVTRIISSLSSFPYDVCLNQNQEIVICCDRENSLLKYSPDGTTLIGNVGGGKKDTHKFYNPYIVTQNGNLDYCVVDVSHVVVVNVHGLHRWTYEGEQGEEKFNPVSICCDRNHCVVVSDCINHKVHVVDKDGQLIKILLTRDHGTESPIGLSVDQEGRLWLGQNDGKVHIVKYKG